MKKAGQEKPKKPQETKVAVTSVETCERAPKKCKFAAELGCTDTHPPWMCRVFRDKTPVERNKIIGDNHICPFCLLHGADVICYTKTYGIKLTYLFPECK